MTEEEIIQMAPGLMQALAPEETEDTGGRPRRRKQDDPMSGLRKWVPKTRLGQMVMAGKVLTYEQALATGLPIREVEIVDALIPNLEDDVIKVNMVQRMTDSGRRVRFNVMACVGNRDGYVGLGMAKAKVQQQSARQLSLLNSTSSPFNVVTVLGNRLQVLELRFHSRLTDVPLQLVSH